MPKLWWFFGRYFTFFKFFSFCFFRFPTREQIKFETFKKRTVYKIGPQLFWWDLNVKTMRIKLISQFLRKTPFLMAFFCIFFLKHIGCQAALVTFVSKTDKIQIDRLFQKYVALMAAVFFGIFHTKKYPSLMPFFGQNMFKNQFLYFFCNALLCLFFFLKTLKMRD